MKKTIEKYLQARDEVSFKFNKAGAKIWYRAHANIETGVIDTGKANGWSCDHDIKINRFQAALILEKYGLTIDQFIDAEKEFYATRYPETNNEANPDDYAVTEDALEVAVNAEIQNANNVKINDLKWEIRYTEGSIDDLDKNHIAHFPQDQSLQERRVELVNELAALKAQLADLLPNEPNTNSEYKYYIQSRRPIAGAVPNGYISATQGEMKVHSLRSDGSISPVPRKVVFGVVVYDHPLSDQQIINYDLHVDPLNPKVEPDNTELSDQEVAEIKRRSQINAIKSRIATYERAIERQYDQELENSLIAAKAQLAEIEPDTEPDEPKFQTGKSYYIKDGDSYYILKVEARTDKMLTGTTPHGTCKYHIHDTFKGEYVRTHLYDDCGNREMIWAANEYTPQVDPIIQERETARNEYEEINQVRRLIEKDCERYERLRDRCKANSPKRKEYNQLLAEFDPIIRAFGQKFIAAQDRYNQSLTLRTDEEKAATQKAIDEYNADLDARGIKYFATVYYYPNGVEGEDMETFCKDCTSLNEANAFVSQDDHDGVYVGGIYDAGWEITDRNGNIVADHITGIKMTNTTQAGFLKDKINRESKSIDDSTTDRDEVFNLLPDLDQLNDVNLDVNALEATIEKITSIYDAVQKASYSAQAELVDYKDAIQKQNAINHGLIDACDVAAWKLTVSRKQVKVFKSIAFKLKQEEKIILDELVHLEIKLERLKDTAPFDLSDDDELIDPPAVCYPLTIAETIEDLNHNINWASETLATMQGDIYSDDWQDWTRAELERAIKDWTEERDDLIIKSGKPLFNHEQKKNLRDSLERAKQIACKNIRVARHNHNKKAEDYERELYDICNQALKEVA